MELPAIVCPSDYTLRETSCHTRITSMEQKHNMINQGMKRIRDAPVLN